LVCLAPECWSDRLTATFGGPAGDLGYEAAELVKVDIKLNGNVVDCMSQILHKGKAEAGPRR